MDLKDSPQERRQEKRRKVKITVLLKMGILVSGRGYVKDISPGGMCLICPQVFRIMKTAHEKDFTGSALRVMFPSHSLTVNGVIQWVDLKKGEGAITIHSTSDDHRWFSIIHGGE